MEQGKLNKQPEPGGIAAPTEPTRSRRRFLLTIWVGLGGVAFVEYLWVLVSFLRPGKSRTLADDAIVVAGPVEQFKAGSVTAFQAGRFYLARLDDGGFLALYRECTHLGCIVPWMDAEQRFVCPCHGSAFDIRGEVLSPPAPRALDRYAVSIDNGIVKVDTSRTISRRSFGATRVVGP
jgi:Rieske Fe-S protein